MTSTYKKVKDFNGNDRTDVVLKTSTTPQISVPFDEANTDYQEYLEWVALGNEAEAAD